MASRRAVACVRTSVKVAGFSEFDRRDGEKKGHRRAGVSLTLLWVPWFLVVFVGRPWAGKYPLRDPSGRVPELQPCGHLGGRNRTRNTTWAQKKPAKALTGWELLWPNHLDIRSENTELQSICWKSGDRGIAKSFIIVQWLRNDAVERCSQFITRLLKCTHSVSSPPLWFSTKHHKRK